MLQEEKKLEEGEWKTPAGIWLLHVHKGAIVVGWYVSAVSVQRAELTSWPGWCGRLSKLAMWGCLLSSDLVECVLMGKPGASFIRAAYAQQCGLLFHATLQMWNHLNVHCHRIYLHMTTIGSWAGSICRGQRYSSCAQSCWQHEPAVVCGHAVADHAGVPGTSTVPAGAGPSVRSVPVHPEPSYISRVGQNHLNVIQVHQISTMLFG